MSVRKGSRFGARRNVLCSGLRWSGPFVVVQISSSNTSAQILDRWPPITNLFTSCLAVVVRLWSNYLAWSLNQSPFAWAGVTTILTALSHQTLILTLEIKTAVRRCMFSIRLLRADILHVLAISSRTPAVKDSTSLPTVLTYFAFPTDLSSKLRKRPDPAFDHIGLVAL